MKPKLLDLFCGAGGASMGYYRAGFDVVGIDIKPQPRYPFPFIQADALKPPVDLKAFDVIHASPPCQAHIKGLVAVNNRRGRKSKAQDLIPQTRELLRQTGLPYVIENVEGAPLVSPVKLCGTYFALPIRRHRLFESNVMFFKTTCLHERFKEKRFYTSYGQRKSEPAKLNSVVVQVYGNPSNAAKSEWGPALRINWMSWRELAQAIPPAYTEFIGRQLLSGRSQ